MKNNLHTSIHDNLWITRKFIDGHLNTPITIEGLSRQAALSPYHFIRAFCTVFKQTPHQYLMQRRIEKAKELLRSTDLSITEICSLVGFESLGSFSTLFRKLVGLSPRSYRKSFSRSAGSKTHHAYIPLCCCILHGINDTN
ncbi:MAG: AraC family transcriptional regulator [Chloroflexota bacterium]